VKKAAKKPRRWRHVSSPKRDVIVLKMVDLMRACSWDWEVGEIVNKALAFSDNNAYECKRRDAS
jgi:hypothetical protein